MRDYIDMKVKEIKDIALNMQDKFDVLSDALEHYELGEQLKKQKQDADEALRKKREEELEQLIEALALEKRK